LSASVSGPFSFKTGHKYLICERVSEVTPDDSYACPGRGELGAAMSQEEAPVSRNRASLFSGQRADKPAGFICARTAASPAALSWPPLMPATAEPSWT